MRTTSCLGTELLNVYASIPAESQESRDVVLHWARRLQSVGGVVTRASKRQKRIGRWQS